MMDTLFITPLIDALQSLSAEMVSVILYGICTIASLILFRCFGAQGLYLYNIVAVIAANIQVLRSVQFDMSAEPIALGTVVFASTYLCSDILTEYYGKEAAKMGVAYCFAAQILMTLLMVISVGYPSLPVENPDYEQMLWIEKALATLFTPSPRILVASLIAFAISQWNDIGIFQMLQKLTGGKWLWLRTSVASIVSAVVDTVLFSVLAWMVLTPTPVSVNSLIFTYILGTLTTRVMMSLLATPVMYLAAAFMPTPLRLRYVPKF